MTSSRGKERGPQEAWPHKNDRQSTIKHDFIMYLGMISDQGAWVEEREHPEPSLGGEGAPLDMFGLFG